MGLIKAALGAINTTLADQWKEYIYCDSMDLNTLMQKGEVRVTESSSNTNRSDNIITNGSKIAVNEGQFMIIVENGKIVDFTAETGAYTYNTGTEPSLFDNGWQGLKESFYKVGKRFAYGGQPENDQRVYFINMKEIMDNKFGVGDVPFRDGEFKFTMMIKSFGVYSYRITNPVMFYTNVAANVSGDYKKDAMDPQLKAEVQNNLQHALARISLNNIAYDKIPLYTKEIAQALNKEITEEWNELRGISIASIAFASITPDAESAKKIAEFQEARVFTNAGMMGARLGTAQAKAMENAASNESGALPGFIGMGLAQQAGGASASQFFNNQQPAAPAAASWACGCGTANTGKFCSECGAQKPEKP